jgi:hypothetical protein
MLKKDVIEPAQHFGKQIPGNYPRAQVDAEGESRLLVSCQGGAHQLTEDYRIDQDHG